jgi:hypothetical protein
MPPPHPASQPIDMSAPNMTPAMYCTVDTLVYDMVTIVDECMAALVKTTESYNNLREKLAVTNTQEMTDEKDIKIAMHDAIETTNFGGYDVMALCVLQSKLDRICDV